MTLSFRIVRKRRESRWVVGTSGIRLLAHSQLVNRDFKNVRANGVSAKAAPLQGADRVGLASEAALHGDQHFAGSKRGLHRSRSFGLVTTRITAKRTNMDQAL